MNDGAREHRRDEQGRPHPAGTDAEVMGRPEPAEEKTEVMGRPEPAEEETDVMGGPRRPTDVMRGRASG